MTNTIPNVPRELLADLLGNDHDKRIMAERHLLAMLTNAPSPAGVDGLNTDRNAAFKACPEYGCDWGSFYLGWKARGEVEQAIIGGLRGEVADLHTTMMAAAVEIQEHWAAHCDEEGYGPANLMHRLERGIASQYGYSAETLVRLESQRDQQAQRIGEMEGLLRDSVELIKHGVFEDGICCCGSSVDSHGFGDGHSPVDALAYYAGQVCERIDAALSAGKDSEQ